MWIMAYEAVGKGRLPQVLQQQMVKQLIQDQGISLDISWPNSEGEGGDVGVCQEGTD